MDDLGSRVEADAAIIGGLLVRLSEEPGPRQSAIDVLSARRELLLGEVRGPWLPVALEAEGPRASRDLHEWILDVPGVRFVEVVAVHFEEDFAETG